MRKHSWIYKVTALILMAMILLLSACNEEPSSSTDSTEKVMYTVTWKNYDGTVLKEESVEDGTVPSYTGSDPVKESDDQYSYTFNGWEPQISAVTADVIYSAQFSSEVKKYTITWKNYDDSVLKEERVEYGRTPSYTGSEPNKKGDDKYSYSFTGWTPEISTVTKDASYKAKFSSKINKYKVTWKNDDGSLLREDTVEYGTVPSYKGSNPTKKSDNQYSYTFDGWTPNVVMVTGDVTYTAKYSSKANAFTVTWKNYDGTTLEIDTNVQYGSIPTYNGSTPQRATDSIAAYSWSGWSPSVEAVKEDITYYAQYTQKSLYDLFEVKDGYAIGKYNGTETRLVIPSVIDGKKITEIGEKAFAGNTKLLSVILPDSVLRIGDSAFDNCTRLYEFGMSKNCTSVGRRCLAKTSITSITIPETLTSFGPYWTLCAPIEKIIFTGNRNKTDFIGEYLGSKTNEAVAIDALNPLKEHFTENEEWVKTTLVSGGYSGGSVVTSQERLPKEIEYTYELKDSNRFFIKKEQTDTQVYEDLRLFANDDKWAYSYGKKPSTEYEEMWWGRVTIRYSEISYIQGIFYVSLDSLKTIEIPASSNMNVNILVGRLENVAVVRK